MGNQCPSEEYYFRDGLTYSFVGASQFGVRYSNVGAIFDVGGSSVFPQSVDIFELAGYLCSMISHYCMNLLNPTINFQVGNIKNLPIKDLEENTFVVQNVKALIHIAKED